MDVGSPEQKLDSPTDQYPLLMERVESHDNHEHIVDVERNGDASSSSSHIGLHPRPELIPLEDRLSSSSDVTANQASVNTPNRLTSTNSSNMRRGDGYRQRRRSPLNSGLWISVEVIVTMSQIIASIVVLSLSRDEHPQAPLFEWIVGYAAGCVATLPILYWRFRNRNRGVERDSNQTHQGSQINHSESTSYTSVTQATDEENQHAIVSSSSDSQIVHTLSSRLNGLVDHFKMGLDCFFAVWFVVGNVWIFGGHASPSDAPKLYRLCIVFLTFSCIGYAMPFILCATICCCLPCIISVLGFREDFSPTRGATAESINALPTYKFKLKQNADGDVSPVDQGGGEGGILASGTEKERFISGEDAVCCICLAKYADDDELKELPCSHVFHVECIDKWLKINALCPLCKSDIGEGNATATLDRNSSQG